MSPSLFDLTGRLALVTGSRAGTGPGYPATELNEALVEDTEFDAGPRARTPAVRGGRLEERVGAAVFPSAAASQFVNGQILYVDGGVLGSL